MTAAVVFFALAMGLSFAALPLAGSPEAAAEPAPGALDWVWWPLAPVGLVLCVLAWRRRVGLPALQLPPNVVASAGIAATVVAMFSVSAVAWVMFTVLEVQSALGAFVAYAAGFGVAAIPALMVLGPAAPRSRRWAPGRGFVLWIAALPLASALALLNAWLLHALGRAAPLQPVLQEFSEGHTWERWVTVIPVVILAPIFEELIFRGAVYRGLRGIAGVWPAAIASALVFSAIHLVVAQALPIFALGVILALAYERSGSLVAPITAHACHNALALLLTAGA